MTFPSLSVYSSSIKHFHFSIYTNTLNAYYSNNIIIALILLLSTSYSFNGLDTWIAYLGTFTSGRWRQDTHELKDHSCAKWAQNSPVASLRLAACLMRSTKGCTIHRLGTVAHLISCTVDMWIKIPGCPSFSISAVKCLITSFQFCGLNAYFMLYLLRISVILPTVWYVKTNVSVQCHYHFLWRQFFPPIRSYSISRLYKQVTITILCIFITVQNSKLFTISFKDAASHSNTFSVE